MFSGLRKLIGLIKVTETGDIISISGLPGNMIKRDILGVWSNSKIVDNLFTHIGNSDISFNKFFAPDIVYAFQRMINEKSSKHNTRAMKRVISHLYENTWLKDTLVKHSDILDFSQLSKLNITLQEHQLTFLETYNNVVPRYKLKGYLVGAGPGTGKTVIGLSLALCAKTAVTICVVPKNAVKRVWAKTLDERFKKVPKYWTSLDDTDPPRGMSHYIVHFDYLENFVGFVSRLGINKPTILLDESHNLNDIESLRTQTFLKLCSMTNSENVIWESGTPVKALGGELAPLFASIDSMFDVDAQKRFAAIYGKATGRANDILAARLGRVTYKVDSKEVVEGEPYFHRIDVKMPNGNMYTLDSIRNEMREFIKERAEYYVKNMRSFEKRYEHILDYFVDTLKTNEEKKEFKVYQSYIKMIRKHYDPVAQKEEAIFCNFYEKNIIMPALDKQTRDEFKNIKSIVKYYKLKIQGEALGQVLGKKRAQCIVDMIPHINMEDIIDTSTKKTVFFTSYVNVVDACSDHLKKNGYKPILVYGKTNSELAGMVGTFEKDIDANPLIATYASLSSAVPLVMANTMLMLNSPFRSYERDQSIARTYRLGQDSQVNVYDVFLETGDEPNISTRSKDILDWSRQQVEEILDFKNSNLVLEELSDELNTWDISLEQINDEKSDIPEWSKW